MADTQWLTQAQYDLLANELKERIEVKRPEIARLIDAARQEGDLRENGGYHAARNEQSMNETRIQALQEMLEHAEVGETPADDGIVEPGMVVTALVAGREQTFLLGSRDAGGDLGIQVFSTQAPLGAAALVLAPLIATELGLASAAIAVSTATWFGLALLALALVTRVERLRFLRVVLGTVVAVLGALVVTGEYASGQIRSSVMAVPRRGRLFVAKALVVSGFAFILGVVCVALSYAISYPFMKGHAGSLTNAHYLGLFWGTGLSFAVVALMALGLGYLTRSTAGAITVVVSLLFVAPIPFGLMAGRWQWAVKVVGLLPDTVSTAVSDPFSLAHHWGRAGTETFLQHWQAIAVFAAWALIPLVIAGVIFTRRDA